MKTRSTASLPAVIPAPKTAPTPKVAASLPAPLPEGTKPKWGLAHPRRGLNHVDSAIAFIDAFPVGSRLTADAFDEWAEEKGLLVVPCKKDKKSDAWKAHLQRRHELRYCLNKAGSHPRMENPFVVESICLGMLEVRAPMRAIGKSKDTKLRKLETLTKTHRRQLAYLMQSIDFTVLPPYERLFTESLYDDIDMLEMEVGQKADNLSAKFSKLETRLRRAVESGEIRPKNGGIKGIIAPDPDEDEREESA